jgi:hypothetical protein
MPVKTNLKIAFLLLIAFSAQATRAQNVGPSSHSRTRGVSSYTIEKARIEDVLRVEDDGYKSVTYVITWKGERAGVDDPLSVSNHHIGDVIKFMVDRWHPTDKPDPRALRFTLLDPPKPKPES